MSNRLKSLTVACILVVACFTGVVYAQDAPAASAAESAKTSKARSGSELHVFTNVAGTGTTNQLVKWTDGAAGTLGDSILTELNGKIGIGTTTPTGLLHLYGTATSDVVAGTGPDMANGPSFNFGYGGASFGRGAGFLNVRPDASATAPNPSLRFMTANVERVIITNTGAVGIGTSTPEAGLTSVQESPLHLYSTADKNTFLTAQNAGTGLNAAAVVKTWSDVASLNMISHASTRTVSRYGLVLGGWNELLVTAGNGLAVGTINPIPVIIGTNNIDRIHVNSDGNVGIGYVTPGTRLDILGTALVYGGARRVMRAMDDSAMAAGVGGGIDFAGKYDTAGNYTQYVNIKGVKSNATSGDLSGKAVVSIDNSLGSMIEIATVDMGGVGVTGNITATGSITSGGNITAGNITATGSITGASVIGAVYQDVAEWVPATMHMEPGTVVVLNRERRNEVMPSAHAYDTAVAGVVSAQPGLILGVGSDSKAQIATTGRVKVHVDATAGPIGIGDLLVTSDRAGTAMKSQPVDLGGVQFHRPGTVIGKALEPLPSGKGDILVLLSLQ